MQTYQKLVEEFSNQGKTPNSIRNSIINYLNANVVQRLKTTTENRKHLDTVVERHTTNPRTGARKMDENIYNTIMMHINETVPPAAAGAGKQRNSNKPVYYHSVTLKVKFDIY